MLLSSIRYREDGTKGFLSDNWTLTTASEHTGYPASKLSNSNLHDRWWAWNQSPSGTYIATTSDVAGFNRTVNVIGLLGINWLDTDPPSQGTWRVRLDDEYPLVDRVRPAISAITLTNLTGSISDISGPIDPPTDPIPVGYVSTRLLASNITLNTEVLVEFTNHHATERALTGNQMLRVHVRMDNSTSVFPTVAATIVPSSGSSFLLSGIIVEPTSEGYIINYPWTAGQLTVPTAAISANIVGTASGGHTVEVIGVELIHELAGVPYDSGEVDLLSRNVFVAPNFELTASSTLYSLSTFSNLAANIIGEPFKAGRWIACSTISADLASPDGFNLTQAGDEHGLQWSEADLTVQALPYDSIFSALAEFRNAVGVISNQTFTRSGFLRGRGVVPFLLIPFDADLTSAMWVVLTDWSTPSVGWWTGDGDSDERWDLNFSVRDAQAKRYG